MALLEVADLYTRFATPDGEVSAVNGVSFAIERGESVGVVGESGSGKTQLFLSILGLLDDNGAASGSARLDGEQLLGLDEKALNRVRGSRLSMIFQDPMTSLNPFLTVGRQLTEVLRTHRGIASAAARQRALDMLELVGIPQPARRIDRYPHEFSGGMRQRVMIAMALLCEPDLLIADEPTTALDVTIQAQIIEQLKAIRERLNTAIVTITHDFGVVAGLCDRVVVMYAGRIVEVGAVEQISGDARHPYTRALLESMPRLDSDRRQQLAAIEGQPPDMQNLPPGCAFHARCAYASDDCRRLEPALLDGDDGRRLACHRRGRL